MFGSKTWYETKEKGKVNILIRLFAIKIANMCTCQENFSKATDLHNYCCFSRIATKENAAKFTKLSAKTCGEQVSLNKRSY